MAWFKKTRKPIKSNEKASRVPEGLWEKCDRCGAVLYRPELEENLEVCPKCNFHMAIRARARLTALFDPGNLQEIGAALVAAFGADARRHQFLQPGHVAIFRSFVLRGSAGPGLHRGAAV